MNANSIFGSPFRFMFNRRIILQRLYMRPWQASTWMASVRLCCVCCNVSVDLFQSGLHVTYNRFFVICNMHV